MFQRVTPCQFYQFARFSAIPFSRYRIVQGMHFNSPPLHHHPSLSAMGGALRRISVDDGYAVFGQDRESIRQHVHIKSIGQDLDL